MRCHKKTCLTFARNKRIILKISNEIISVLAIKFDNHTQLNKDANVSSYMIYSNVILCPSTVSITTFNLFSNAVLFFYIYLQSITAYRRHIQAQLKLENAEFELPPLNTTGKKTQFVLKETLCVYHPSMYSILINYDSRHLHLV